MKIYAKNIPLSWYNDINLYSNDSNSVLIEGKEYNSISIRQCKYLGVITNFYSLGIREYPVDWFYTEKEYHSMKFNNKVKDILDK